MKILCLVSRAAPRKHDFPIFYIHHYLKSQQQPKKINYLATFTLPKFNMEPENGTLE